LPLHFCASSHSKLVIDEFYLLRTYTADRLAYLISDDKFAVYYIVSLTSYVTPLKQGR